MCGEKSTLLNVAGVFSCESVDVVVAVALDVPQAEEGG